MTPRPSLSKIAFYLFTKYLVFYTVLGFMGSRFKTLIMNNATTTYGAFLNAIGYLIEVLFATLVLIVLMIIPVYYLFKLNNLMYIILAFFVVVVYEYFTYESMDSYVHFDIDGIVNGFISVVFLPLFFGRFILSFRHKGSAQK
ncbi:MAG: hypothetical protein NVSMB24_08720 [Mucilaginibacter sp.]